MPFGPRVDFTRSPNARAPTNEERRAFSAFSSVACSNHCDQYVIRVAYESPCLVSEYIHGHFVGERS
jgi:hypothetical protein